MSRFPLNTPFMLGFDNLERLIEQMTKTGSEGFPPYNVIQTDETHLRISLAVAGYGEEELDVAIEDNQLVIRGHREEDEGVFYLYKGIAGRSFQKSFVLAQGIEVIRAFCEKGLLHIDLEKQEPEKKITKIKIEGALEEKNGN
ncbi:MAG: Hsp20 family protein [Alphaproteobacteria bacterium]|nr:Hsp20 family protein [Alphaproteobacteria bacterium]